MINTKFTIFDKDKSNNLSPFEKDTICFVVGPTGSGKSTVTLNLLKHIQKNIDDIEKAYYFTGSKKDQILKNLGTDMFISNDPEVFNNLMNEIELESFSPRRLIVLDDVISNPFFNLNTSKKFLNFVLNHRHNSVILAITGQGWNQLSKQIRGQISLIFCFVPRNEKQRADIADELPVSKEKLNKAMEIVKASGDHAFLYLNLQHSQPRFHIGFDKEIEF